MWNLRSIYSDFNSNDFINDLEYIKSLSDEIKFILNSKKYNHNNIDFNNVNLLYEKYYTIFNKLMSYTNLSNMSLDINNPKKTMTLSYLSELRAIHNSVQPLVEKENLNFSILKPSSDTFKDLYYKSKSKYSYSSEELSLNSSFALKGIKRNVLKLASMNGYTSPLMLALEIYQIPVKSFNNMISTVENLIPYFKSHKIKTQATSCSSEELSSIDFSTSKQIILDSCKNFSKESYEFINRAFYENWIDISPVSSDALCISIPSISEFRVKLKYTNDLKSTISLAHELGHAYHGSILYKDNILRFSDYPISIGETSALFFEELAYEEIYKNYSRSFFKDEIDLQYISNLNLFTLDVYARYLFEAEIYNNLEKGDLDVTEVENIMKESLEYVYGSESEVNINLWIDKSHYYNFSRPYYNIPYIFGLFIEKILFQLYSDNKFPNFPELYKEFYFNTNKIPIKENIKNLFNINIESKSIWKEFESIIISNLV